MTSNSWFKDDLKCRNNHSRKNAYHKWTHEKVFRVWKNADVTFLLDPIKYVDWTLWKKYSEEL